MTKRTSVILLMVAFCLALPKEVIGQKEELDEQMRLKQEIQLLNLLKGLYLSQEQMEFLIEQARKVSDIKEDFREQQRQYSADSIQTLERLKEEVADDTQEVSQDLAREVHQKISKKMLELRANHNSQMEGIIAEVKNNLTGKQLSIIEEFQPCLVPPKGPARFGQAEGSEGLAKRLERIRAIPDYKYVVEKDEIAGRFVEKVRLHKRKEEQLDEYDLRNKILSLFDQARNLSEIDFNLKKEELARTLKEYIHSEPKDVNVDKRIERFLLTPVAADLLEKKLSE